MVFASGATLQQEPPIFVENEYRKCAVQASGSMNLELGCIAPLDVILVYENYPLIFIDHAWLNRERVNASALGAINCVRTSGHAAAAFSPSVTTNARIESS